MPIQSQHQAVHDRLLRASSPAWLPGLVQNTGVLLEGYLVLAHIDKTPWRSARFPAQGLAFQELAATNPAKARAFPEILRRNQAPGPHAVPAVLTHAPPLDPLGRYEGARVVRVGGFEPRFHLAASGNSKPVIMACLGSDGRRYKQVGGLSGPCLRIRMTVGIHAWLFLPPPPFPPTHTQHG